MPCTLSQCQRVSIGKCGSMCELCTVMCAREQCASARVQADVVSTPPVALTAVAAGWVRNSDSATSVEVKLEQDSNQAFLVDGDNVELVVLTRVAPVSWMLFRLLWEREFDVVSLCHCSAHLSSCHLCGCHFCPLWDELHHDGLGDQLEDDDGCCGRS